MTINNIKGCGLKRTTDEALLDEGTSNNTNNTSTEMNNTMATPTAMTATDISDAIMSEDAEAQKIGDALQAWEEVGDLSKAISRGVFEVILKRLRKFRRLARDNNFSIDDNNSAGDSAPHGTAAAEASVSSSSSRPANTYICSGDNIRKKAAFLDMIQRAERMQRQVLLFCYHHEKLRRELEELLEKASSRDSDEDEAVASRIG